jgi:hypothetical protein
MLSLLTIGTEQVTGKGFPKYKFSLNFFLAAFFAISAFFFVRGNFFVAVGNEQEACGKQQDKNSKADIGFLFHEKVYSLIRRKVHKKCYGIMNFLYISWEL